MQKRERKYFSKKNPIRRFWPFTFDSAVSLVALCTHHMCQTNRYSAAATPLQSQSRGKYVARDADLNWLKSLKPTITPPSPKKCSSPPNSYLNCNLFIKVNYINCQRVLIKCFSQFHFSCSHGRKQTVIVFHNSSLISPKLNLRCISLNVIQIY